MPRNRYRNVAELFKNTQFMVADRFEVFSWSPGRADEQVPCTEVHVLCTKPKHGNAAFVLRLKSRQATQELIDALIAHRDDVWPGPETDV